MAYLLCNGDKFFAQNHDGMYMTTSYAEALKWTNIDKAKHTLKNVSNHKKFKNCHFEIRYAYDGNHIASTEESAVEIHLDYDILDKVREINKFISEIQLRKAYLNGEISKIDLEIVDIEHAAEFYNLNASQGYKIYRMLHDAKVKRRDLKDEATKIDMVLGTALWKNKLDNLEKGILGLDNRQYTPRVNAELFNV